MTSTTTPYEVAVIDEIQMMKDYGRGWAWTRALLGVCANEIHVCGEPAAIDLVKAICITTGEEVEVRHYKRLTELTVEDGAVCSLTNIQPGDCVVCFSKNDIYTVSRQIERQNRECAVIYGGLPPGTKLAQAKRFNDPDDPCKIMVATDAIGMGLNLSIRRVVFYSLIKPTLNEKGEKEMDVLSTSQALQIAGRAGRYGTQFEHGYVTTFKAEDLPTLKSILSGHPDTLEQAGLHPTADQIELYAYHLPNATLSNLIDIFVNLSTMDDSLYFMCTTDDFKFLADMIQHVPLPLRARYVFCCAPINKKMPFVCTMFLKFARQYSRNELLTLDWLYSQIGWPFAAPRSLVDLVHLEAVFDVLDLYLWLSNRFPDLFPDSALVRDMQGELDNIIAHGVQNITRLLKNSETTISSGQASVDDGETFTMKRISENFLKGPSYSVGEELEEESRRMVRGSPALGLATSTKTRRQQGKREEGERPRLTERLIAQGLLTPRMLEDLRKEWSDQAKHNQRLRKRSKKDT